MERRKIVKPSMEQLSENPLNMVGEPSIIERIVDGKPTGACTVLMASHVEMVDDAGKKQDVLGVIFTNKFIQYVLDPDGSAKYNDEEGTIEFSSRGVQYKIRAIQPGEPGYRDL